MEVTVKKLKPHKTSYQCYFEDQTKTKCKRINIDSGCKIDLSQSYYPQCKVDKVQDNEDCFFTTDRKTCEKKTKRCDLYYESTCGGLKGISNNKQCIQRNSRQCEEITIDDNCRINEVSSKCEKKDGATFDTVKEHCKFNEEETECKKQQKECDEYDTDKCQRFNTNCYKVKKNYLPPFDVCQMVTLDDKCEINTNGDCQDKSNANLEVYQKCAYNKEYTKCQVTDKGCTEMTSDCNRCRSSSSGFTCSKVDGLSYCQEVEIDSSCQIDTDGKCVKRSTESNKNECRFNWQKTKCIFYQVDSQCKLDETNPYCQDGTLSDDNKKCDFQDDAKTKCQPRAKECSEFLPGNCEGVKTSTNKKCSWYNTNFCKEYTNDSYCTVDQGICKRADGVDDNQFGTTQECLFDLEEKSCTKKNKVCQNYYKDCSSLSSDSIQCLKFYEQNYCKQIQIDENCHINENGYCTNKTSIENDKICDFDKEIDPTSCKIREKYCDEYDYNSRSTCNAKSNCAYINSKCYEFKTDDKCSVSNGQCGTKTGVTLSDYEKCFWNYNSDEGKYSCEIGSKSCNEFNSNSNTCNNYPKTEKMQCYYSSSTCKTIYLDGNCYVNSTGYCVEDGTGKLSQYEICAFSDSTKTSCGKKEKQCSDYSNDNCGDFTPEMKLCFYINSECKQVEVDSQCHIDENNECKGDSCKFDDNSDRCYYQKNESNLLKLKQFMLFILFVML